MNLISSIFRANPPAKLLDKLLNTLGNFFNQNLSSISALEAGLHCKAKLSIIKMETFEIAMPRVEEARCLYIIYVMALVEK